MEVRLNERTDEKKVSERERIKERGERKEET
jgi:hypothetical protein